MSQKKYSKNPFPQVFFKIYDFTLPWYEKRIPKGSRVLDVGFGTGYLGERIFSTCDLSELVAIDLDVNMSKSVALKLGSNGVKVLSLDAENPNLHKVLGTFDVIIVRNTFHHFHRKSDFLLLIRDKLLNKNGALLLTDLDAKSNYSGFGMGLFFTLLRVFPLIGFRTVLVMLKKTNLFQKKDIRQHRNKDKELLKKQKWYYYRDIKRKVKEVLPSSKISRFGHILGFGGCYSIHYKKK